jgi:hypothetical protein
VIGKIETKHLPLFPFLEWKTLLLEEMDILAGDGGSLPAIFCSGLVCQ